MNDGAAVKEGDGVSAVAGRQVLAAPRSSGSTSGRPATTPAGSTRGSGSAPRGPHKPEDRVQLSAPPPTFRALPVTVEAMRFHAADDAGYETVTAAIKRWARLHGVEIVDIGTGERVDRLSLRLPDGIVSANRGDWIVRCGPLFFPLEPSVFLSIFRPAGRAS